MTKPEIKRMDAFSAVCYTFGPENGDINILENGAYWEGKDFSSIGAEDYKKLTYPDYAEVGFWYHSDPCLSDFIITSVLL